MRRLIWFLRRSIVSDAPKTAHKQSGARLGRLVLPAPAETLSFVAFGVGSIATAGRGVLQITGCSRRDGRVPGGTRGGARNAWPCGAK